MGRRTRAVTAGRCCRARHHRKRQPSRRRPSGRSGRGSSRPPWVPAARRSAPARVPSGRCCGSRKAPTDRASNSWTAADDRDDEEGPPWPARGDRRVADESHPDQNEHSADGHRRRPRPPSGHCRDIRSPNATPGQKRCRVRGRAALHQRMLTSGPHWPRSFGRNGSQRSLARQPRRNSAKARPAMTHEQPTKRATTSRVITTTKARVAHRRIVQVVHRHLFSPEHRWAPLHAESHRGRLIANDLGAHLGPAAQHRPSRLPVGLGASDPRDQGPAGSEKISNRSGRFAAFTGPPCGTHRTIVIWGSSKRPRPKGASTP